MVSRNPEWLKWLRVAMADGAYLATTGAPPRPLPKLAVLTGQDMRALAAIAACWQLLASSDEVGEQAALAAVRMLLPALQPECRQFARELIPFAMDWSHREKVWPEVLDDG